MITHPLTEIAWQCAELPWIAIRQFLQSDWWNKPVHLVYFHIWKKDNALSELSNASLGLENPKQVQPGCVFKTSQPPEKVATTTRVYHNQYNITQISQSTHGWFQYKDGILLNYQCRKLHCGDEAVTGLLNFQHWATHTGKTKMASLYLSQPYFSVKFTWHAPCIHAYTPVYKQVYINRTQFNSPCIFTIRHITGEWSEMNDTVVERFNTYRPHQTISTG